MENLNNLKNFDVEALSAEEAMQFSGGISTGAWIGGGISLLLVFVAVASVVYCLRKVHEDRGKHQKQAAQDIFNSMANKEFDRYNQRAMLENPTF